MDFGSLKRRGDWPGRASAVVRDHMRVPFRYGEADCWQFAGKMIEALLETAENPAAQFRGAYRTLEDGNALLRESGWGDLVGWLRALQFEEIEPAKAKRFDFLIYDTEGEPGIGILAPNGRLAGLWKRGIGYSPREIATTAFRVG